MSDLEEYLEYCRERDAWEDARDEQQRIEEQQEIDERKANDEKVNADFSVKVGALLLFAKVVPYVNESGSKCYRWYLAFACNMGTEVRTMLLEDGECIREKSARRAAFESISETMKTMSQMVETWNLTESTAKAMI